MTLAKEEINRKLLHVVSGSLMPLGIFYIPKLTGWSLWSPAIILATLLVPSAAVEFLRLRSERFQKFFYVVWGAMLRREESKKLTGWTWVFSGAVLCSVVFYNEPHISFIVLSLFIFGDGVAALVGLSMGRIKIGNKSLEGSTACFLLCLVFCFAVFPLVPGVLDTWDGRMPVALGISISLAITVQELFPIRLTRTITINDNLSVPVITGIIIKFLSTMLQQG
jgi:dolichol kinase